MLFMVLSLGQDRGETHRRGKPESPSQRHVFCWVRLCLGVMSSRKASRAELLDHMTIPMVLVGANMNPRPRAVLWLWDILSPLSHRFGFSPEIPMGGSTSPAAVGEAGVGGGTQKVGCGWWDAGGRMWTLG